MILPDKFTPEELERELLADNAEIEIRYMHYIKANFSKTKRFLNTLPKQKLPYDTQTKMYKSSNNNTWFCYQTISNKKLYRRYDDFNTTMFCIANSPNGYYVYTVVNGAGLNDMESQERVVGKLIIPIKRSFRVFTPHFFRRYNERNGLELPNISTQRPLQDVVKEFFYYNVDGVSSVYNLRASKEFNTETDVVEISAQGFSLGYKLARNIHILKTWVSWDMELPHQKELFDSLKNELRIYQERYSMLNFQRKD